MAVPNSFHPQGAVGEGEKENVIQKEYTHTPPVAFPARAPLKNIQINKEPGSSGKSDSSHPLKQFREDELNNICTEYSMNHQHRGKLIIFSHSEFDDFLCTGPRKNSHIDVMNLESTFKGLGFTTLVFQNLKKEEILNLINKFSREDFSNDDCVWVTVLSHGMHKNFIYARDVAYHFDELWKPFTRCKSLAGKPKIFTIQACRGEQIDPGIQFSPHSDEIDIATSPLNTPAYADFLLIFSSVEGFVSYRDVSSGSWLIHSLCKELRENSSRLDVERMLTNVKRVVASYKTSDTGVLSSNDLKQVPSVVTMLTKQIYLRPKT